MAIRNLSSYSANIYSGNSSSNQLASLLKASSLNKVMLKKAYTALEKSTGKPYLNKTDTNSQNSTVSDINKYLQSENSQTSTENADALKKNTAEMRESSVSLLSAKSMSDDDLVSSVKAFAEDYNNTVKTLKNSDNYVAVSSGINMVNTTKSYSVSLKKVGITVNDDNTLSVNETVMKDNINSAKSMFNGNYSYGGKMAKKASDLQSIAKLSITSGAGIYNRYGVFYGSGNQ